MRKLLRSLTVGIWKVAIENHKHFSQNKCTQKVQTFEACTYFAIFHI